MKTYSSHFLCLLFLVPAVAEVDSPFITVNEGSPVNITCTVSGVPIPNVSWELNDQIAPFMQTITHVNVSTTTNGHVLPGKVISTLHLINPLYPDHQGTYECTGENEFGRIAGAGIALSLVNIQGNISNFAVVKCS